MGKYYEALKRGMPEEIAADAIRFSKGRRATGVDNGVIAEGESSATATSGSVVHLPVVDEIPAVIARDRSIQTLTEQLAPISASDSQVRILVSGCRPGDGASTVAAALAIDLSERRGMRTLVVDGHLRRPALNRMFSPRGSVTGETVLEGLVRLRPTGRLRLELASLSLAGEGLNGSNSFDRFEDLIKHYRAVVVDLGVVRLEPRLLPLARLGDPILLVVRYGHTERQELASTSAGLRAAKRPPAGVILNAATKPTTVKIPVTAIMDGVSGR